MNDPQNDRTSADIEAAALALPHDSSTAEHSTRHIEAALRASGLDSEVAEVLPVRDQGLPVRDAWGEWEDAAWTGAFGRRPRLDPVVGIRWPRSLYIPRGADYRDYWLVPPPDRQRYAHAWPAVGNGVRPDWASADTGELFAYTIVPWTEPSADTRSEAGIGILFSPDFTLGTVDFEPIVNVKDGVLASVLEYFPAVSAGSVTLTASVVLAAWQVIPGGYDLLDYASVPIARIMRDQSHGPERAKLPGSLYTPRPFRKRFLVQKGREYLFGAVGRVQATSTLTAGDGRPLVGPNGANFKVYGWITLGIPYMTVETAQVHLP